MVASCENNDKFKKKFFKSVCLPVFTILKNNSKVRVKAKAKKIN